MARYSAFVALDSGLGHYQELDELIDAPDPRAAAQQVIDSGAIEPAQSFPLVLIVEEHAVSIFTRDRQRHAVAPMEGIRQRLREGQDPPQLRVLTDDEPQG